jgi:hypothetical protein
VKASRRTLILCFIGFWAFAVLCVGFWLNSLWEGCKQYGDLQAECFAPVGALIYKSVAILIGVSGIALWLVASRRKPDKDR